MLAGWLGPAASAQHCRARFPLLNDRRRSGLCAATCSRGSSGELELCCQPCWTSQHSGNNSSSKKALHWRACPLARLQHNMLRRAHERPPWRHLRRHKQKCHSSVKHVLQCLRVAQRQCCHSCTCRVLYMRVHSGGGPGRRAATAQSAAGSARGAVIAPARRPRRPPRPSRAAPP